MGDGPGDAYGRRPLKHDYPQTVWVLFAQHRHHRTQKLGPWRATGRVELSEQPHKRADGMDTFYRWVPYVVGRPR